MTKRTRLDEINEEIAELLTTEGLVEIANLMAAKLGGNADDYKPFLLAAVLESSIAIMGDLADNPLEVLTLGDRVLRKSMTCAVASERIGRDWKLQVETKLGKKWPEKAETVCEILANQPAEN